MKTDKFIDPKSDYAFKVIFGTVANKELTIRFLSSLLGKDIRNITYHNVERQGVNADSRRAVFDRWITCILRNTVGMLCGWTGSCAYRSTKH